MPIRPSPMSVRDPWRRLANQPGSIVELVRDLVFLLDPAGVIVGCNTRVTEALGQAPGALQGTAMASLTADPDPAAAAFDCHALLAARRREFAISLRRVDGSLMPGHAVARALTLDSASFLQLVVQDLTDQRQAEAAALAAEEAQRGSEAWSQLFFELPLVGMGVSSPSSKRWLRVNPRLCEILGYSEAQLLSKSWELITHPDDLAADRAEFERVLRGEQDSYHMEKRFLRADGEVVETLMHVMGVRDRAGRAQSFFATIDDITERKRTQRALADEEAKFHALAELSLVGIFMLDGDRFVYANPATAALLGIAPEALPDKTVADFVAGRALVVAGHWMQQLALGDTEQFDEILPVRRGDGHLSWLAVQGRVMFHQGRPLLIGTMRDITAEQRARTTVRRQVRQLRRAMLATVETVSRVADLRDPYTAGHERRVGVLAAVIGAALGHDAETCEGLKMIGAVHDIGKVAVPAEILSKPGRLTQLEYRLVQAHVTKGYEILQQIDFPWPVAEVVLQHHERLDGSGYPQGLRGDQILPLARIIAVADVFESMSSHRPYRPALGVDAALAELESKAGSAYDAEVVRACAELARGGQLGS